MLHGGALEYGSSKNPTTALATHAWHPLRVYKQSGFDSRLRPQFFRSGSRIASTIGQCTRFLPGEVRVQVPGGPRLLFSRCGEVVSHLPWAQGIGGSNPLTSTNSMGARAALPVIARSPTETMRAEHPSLCLKRDSGLSSLQVWLNGRAPRCQRGDCGFETRHLLQGSLPS